MNAKQTFIGSLISGTVLMTSGWITPAFASGSAYYDEATVISAEPLYRTVRVSSPRTECWDEPVYSQRQASTSKTPEILGTIIGAAVGRNFGSGRGQDVATVAGAILGGSIGHDTKNRNRQNDRVVSYQEKCTVVDDYHTEERVDGYSVKYRYNGNIYTTHTDHDPGRTIKVSVNVTPVE